MVMTRTTQQHTCALAWFGRRVRCVLRTCTRKTSWSGSGKGCTQLQATVRDQEDAANELWVWREGLPPPKLNFLPPLTEEKTKNEEQRKRKNEPRGAEEGRGANPSTKLVSSLRFGRGSNSLPPHLIRYTPHFKFRRSPVSSFQFQIRYSKISDIQIAVEAINTTAISRQRR